MHKSACIINYIIVMLCTLCQGQPLAYGGLEEIMQTCVEEGTLGTVLSEILASPVKDLEKFPLGDDIVNHTAKKLGECARISQGEKSQSSIAVDSLLDEPDNFSNEIEEEDKGHVSMMTYISYFKAGGGYFFNCFMALLFLLTQVHLNSTQYC